MTEDVELKYGKIQEKNDVIIYEIPRVQTQLIDPEQLDELKRDHNIFLTCQHYIVDEAVVRIFYKRESQYARIKTYKDADDKVKKAIANNLVDVVNIEGTQYTTFIHPANIYVSKQGNVKYAHRGIRSVLPPKELSLTELLGDIKQVIIYLYTSYSFNEIASVNMNEVTKNNVFLKGIHQATTVEELKAAINQELVEPPVQPLGQISAKNEKVKAKSKSKSKSKSPLGYLALLLASLVIVAGAMYLLLVNPQINKNNALSKEYKGEKKSLIEETTRLETEVSEQQTIIEAYRSVVEGDAEKAVSLFESIEPLNDSDELVLMEHYLLINTVDSLKQAIERNDLYEVPVVESLAAHNTPEANDLINAIESDEPIVLLEQAWNRTDYGEVIKIYEVIPDYDRAKHLAALSYLKEKNFKKALPLAVELENKDLQIASYKLELEAIKANKDLEKDEKKEQTNKINKKIKKLN